MATVPFAVATEEFMPLVNALIKSKGGFIERLNNTALVPDGARSGAVTARITTAVTPQAITDGTLPQNFAARSEVALTAFAQQHPIKLQPYQINQFLNSPDAIEKELRAAASGFYVSWEGEVIADLVAGTPGNTQTLTAGQIDFATDGTDAEAYDNLRKFDQALAYIEANTNGSTSDLWIVMPTVAYGNFITMLGSSRYGAKNLEFGRESMQEDERQYFYKGIPIYKTTVTTNFGGAAKECAYIGHRDAEAALLVGVEDQGAATGQPGFRPMDDGLTGMILQTYGFAGLIQAGHYAAIMNPTI